MKLNWDLFWALDAVVLVVGMYWYNFRPYTYRYRMTVEVETPQGPRAGWAVREVRLERLHKLRWGSIGARIMERGEAVAVDLPGGQTLFALICLDPSLTWSSGFGEGMKSVWDAAKADKRIGVMSPMPQCPAERSGYPQLVRFRDPDDAKSIELVDPANLAAAFGAGVTLRRITIQMTDDPVTVDVERRLPDFGPATGYFDWRRSLPNGDSRREFSKELFVR